MTALHALAKGVEHPAPLRQKAPAWLVTVGLFAAPVAWLLQLLVSYGLNGDLCRSGAAIGAQGPVARSVLLAIIGIFAVAICLLGLVSAFRTWRLTRREAPGDHHAALTAGVGRTRFLGLSGMVAGCIFLIATLFALLIPFLISPCAMPFL